MIRTPTVFVLGAGASAPYGFPLGASLADAVCRGIEGAAKNYALRSCLLKTFSEELVSAFPTEFRRSGQYSIDAFVERRREFRDLAKVAIVQILTPCENEEWLLSPPRTDDQDQPAESGPAGKDRDWYRYLLSKIVPPKPEDFAGNKLKVITFNFDRSFERRLFVALQSTYKLSDADTERLASDIPVLHMHGDLAAAAWLPSAAAEPQRRFYQSENVVDTAADYANRLSLVDDEIPAERVREAVRWLDEAEVVCFLGFGYHPLNLNRLDVGGLEHVIRGTSRGLATGEVDAVRRAFNRDANVALFQKEQFDILEFLRHTSSIHF